MRILSCLAVASLTAACFLATGCGGDDDDTPPSSNTGGTSGTGGSSGSGGSNPGSGGSDPGTGGTDPGTGGGDNTGGMGGGGSGGCDLSGADKEREVIEGPITSDMTLSSDKVYTLNSFVYVEDGATLTIPACTRIEGEENGTLVIARGAKLIADGQADAPILFTSALPEGDRDRGDWGGVILLGRAPNFVGNDARIEGLPGEESDIRNFYGGTDPEDNSGILRFVRIEFSGSEIAQDNEINGLTMGSVGSGTVIENVEVNTTLDDCFEWFGGTVNAKNLIANNCGDDMFDADTGYTGTIENAFGRQIQPRSSDPNGFEWDSLQPDPDVVPTTNVTANNVTLCGVGREGKAIGMVLRENVRGAIDNAVVVGFDVGVDTRDAFGTAEAPRVTLANSFISGNTLNPHDPAETDDDAGFDEAAWVAAGENNSLESPGFTKDDCTAAGGPAAAVTGSGNGAFADGADWLNGAWVSWTIE